MKIPKAFINKILSIDEDCCLCQPIPELSPYFFELLTKHRSKMLKWSTFAKSIKNLKDADNWLKEIYFFNQGGQKFNSVIICEEEFAGILALHRIDKANKRAEIGYWVNHDHQGKGLINKTISPFLNYVFRNYEINRIDLIVGVENEKSISIAKKSGFEKEGLLKEYLIFNDQVQDVFIFRMLKSDFSHLMK